MRKLNRVSMQMAAVALAIAVATASSIAIAPPADAGSRNRDKFLEAAKKNYRGDPAVRKALKAQQKAERSAIHSGTSALKKAGHAPLKEERRKRTDEQLRRIQAGDLSAGSHPHKKKSSPHEGIKYGAEAASPHSQRQRKINDAAVNLLLGIQGIEGRLDVLGGSR